MVGPRHSATLPKAVGVWVVLGGSWGNSRELRGLASHLPQTRNCNKLLIYSALKPKGEQPVLWTKSLFFNRPPAYRVNVYTLQFAPAGWYSYQSMRAHARRKCRRTPTLLWEASRPRPMGKCSTQVPVPIQSGSRCGPRPSISKCSMSSATLSATIQRRAHARDQPRNGDWGKAKRAITPPKCTIGGCACAPIAKCYAKSVARPYGTRLVGNPGAGRGSRSSSIG